ncbi:putative glycosyl transferase [mine drainage metagenome]|uniref:Putative glycosyl transferase n=1 Tax=mine drainage metagenome TaxID=410659 RepID=A0A1J5SF27_9ZZZZ
MRIWLVTIGEPIFHSENKLRLHRTGILSKYLIENTNHDVIWWTSSFSHFEKKHLFDRDTFVKVDSRFQMIVLKGKGYKRNISIDRIIDHSQIAKKFDNLKNYEEKPDIIVAAFPTMGLCKVALDFAKKNKIPVVIDYRDMWPEVYVDIIPQRLQFIGRLFLKPLYKNVANIFKEATGIFGITQDFLNLALKKIKRKQNGFDGVFPLGYLTDQYLSKDLEDARLFWSSKLNVNSKSLKICYFGAIGYQSNWDTIIKAAEYLYKEKLDVEIIICGSGDKLQELKDSSHGNTNILFPGFVSAAQIKALMEISDIGLCAYYPKESYLNSIPGKAIEYLSSGLPILSTLEKGTLGKLLNDYNIGYHYIHDSHHSLINVIKKILETKNELQEKSDLIKNIYMEHFDANEVYRKYTEQLEYIVNSFQR